MLKLHLVIVAGIFMACAVGVRADNFDLGTTSLSGSLTGNSFSVGFGNPATGTFTIQDTTTNSTPVVTTGSGFSFDANMSSGTAGVLVNFSDTPTSGPSIVAPASLALASFSTGTSTFFSFPTFQSNGLMIQNGLLRFDNFSPLSGPPLTSGAGAVLADFTYTTSLPEPACGAGLLVAALGISRRFRRRLSR
jgi:hypothetical protein